MVHVAPHDAQEAGLLVFLRLIVSVPAKVPERQLLGDVALDLAPGVVSKEKPPRMAMDMVMYCVRKSAQEMVTRRTSTSRLLVHKLAHKGKDSAESELTADEAMG